MTGSERATCPINSLPLKFDPSFLILGGGSSCLIKAGNAGCTGVMGESRKQNTKTRGRLEGVEAASWNHSDGAGECDK